jgi:hypothetical protein
MSTFLSDTCWDYLNCTTKDAQKLFCGRDEYAVQYCRKTCGKCHRMYIYFHSGNFYVIVNKFIKNVSISL